MIGIAAISVALMVGVGLFLMLSRNTQLIAMGFLLLSNGVNLLVITSGGIPAGAVPPLIGYSDGRLADPLPQAFILTAIVIGLGASAFLLAMAARHHEVTGKDSLRSKEPPR